MAYEISTPTPWEVRDDGKRSGEYRYKVCMVGGGIIVDGLLKADAELIVSGVNQLKEADKLRQENAELKKLAVSMAGTLGKIKGIANRKALDSNEDVVYNACNNALAKAKEAGIDTGGTNG